MRKTEQCQRPFETTCSRATRRKDKHQHLCGKGSSDKSCAQHRGYKEIGGSGYVEGLMAWLREIGLEFVDITVKSDNKPPLTSFIESWRSTLRAMKSGSRMIMENRPVGSSESNGIVERAIQSVQGNDQNKTQRDLRKSGT